MTAAARHAEVAIIGGGIVGTSIAYHVAKLGRRVLLLEKSGLTHGSTWHAAGLVGQLRSSPNLTRVLQHSTELYGRLEEETGVTPAWRPVGSLRLASSRARWGELKRAVSIGKGFGFDVELVGPSDVERLCPVVDTRRIYGAAYVPSARRDSAEHLFFRSSGAALHSYGYGPGAHSCAVLRAIS